MDEVNRTLFIPLYGKSKVSKQKIILHDPMAEKIWKAESFSIHGKWNSKWLAYNMAMRARIFDDWTDEMLVQHKDALVLHMGCGLDSRCLRVKQSYGIWIDCDFPKVISLRRKYYTETENYHMMSLDISHSEQMALLPHADTTIVLLEGVSMYLSPKQVWGFFRRLQEKYQALHILMDTYTVLGVKMSQYKNPVKDVGVTLLYGIDDIESILNGLEIRCIKEHSLTPIALVNELPSIERLFFKVLFTGSLYKKIYRLFEFAL